MPLRPQLRRLAGLVALVGALGVGGLLLRATAQVVTVTVHYRMGQPPPARVSAVYRKPGDPEILGRFETTLTAVPVVHRARLPKGSIEVTVEVADRAPEVRRFEAEADREITLSLEPPP